MKHNALVLLGLSLLTCAPAGAASPQSASLAARLKAPDGLRVSVYADGLKNPRLMAVAPNGDLFVADQGAGRVYVLPDRNGDGVADSKQVFAEGLNAPHSLAFHGAYLYVANTDARRALPVQERRPEGQHRPHAASPTAHREAETAKAHRG